MKEVPSECRHVLQLQEYESQHAVCVLGASLPRGSLLLRHCADGWQAWALTVKIIGVNHPHLHRHKQAQQLPKLAEAAHLLTHLHQIKLPALDPTQRLKPEYSSTRQMQATMQMI